MKFYLAVIGLLGFICQGSGQVTVGGLQRNSIDLNNRAGGVIQEIKPPVREIQGSTYLDDQWMPGKIEFKNGNVLEDILLRYDISMDQIEVKIDGVLKGVSGKNAKSFTIFNPLSQSNDYYINANMYQEAGNKHSGFFKVFSLGEWSLLEKTIVTFEEANYNPVLDVGNEEPSYVKSSTLYMAHNNSIVVVSKSKKKFLEFLNEHSEATAAYMKEKSLSIKETSDIKLIVDFLNKKV